MNELPSAEFRKQYGKLQTATIVTANGHPIGLWMPRGIRDFTLALEQVEELADHEVPPKVRSRAEAQVQRDELLRKINRRS